MKKTAILLLVLLWAKGAFAQNKQRDIALEEIAKGLVINSKTDSLKDSVALYAFAFRVVVKRIKNKAIIESQR